MGNVTLPITSRTSSDDNDFQDVLDNDEAIVNVVNGNIASTNLADGSVTTAKIADGAVTSDKLAGSIGTGDATAGFDDVATEETTTSTSYTDLSTAGPSVTITVPTNGFVKVFAEVQMKTSAGTCRVGLYEATDLSTPADILASTATDYETRRTTPSVDTGLTTITRAGSLDFPATAGSRTYTLKYKTSSGTASFKARKLWVVAFDPS